MRHFVLALSVLAASCTAVQTRVIADVNVTKPDGAEERLTAEALQSHDLSSFALLCALTGLFYGCTCWGYLAAPFDGQELAAMEAARADVRSLGSCVDVGAMKVETASWSAAPRRFHLKRGDKRLSRAEAEGLCRAPQTAATRASIAAAAVAGLERHFDRFKNITSLTAPMTVQRGAPSAVILHMSMAAMTAFPGETPPVTAPPVALFFNFAFPDWHYLDCHSVDMLVDGLPLNLDEPKHTGDVREGGVFETVRVRVPVTSVPSLANAQRVEFRICRDEMEFDAASIARLREMLVSVGAAAPPPADDAPPTPGT